MGDIYRMSIPWRRRWNRWQGGRRTFRSVRAGTVRRRSYRQWPYGARGSSGGNVLTTQEYKSSTINFASQTPFDTGVVLLLTTVAQGTGDNQRIGNVIVIKKLMMRVCMNATGTSKGNCYRIMVLYDKQFNKATPATSDILVGGLPHSSRDFLDLTNRNRFMTLFNSGIFNLGANTNDNDNRTIEWYCKCNAETIFSGAGSTAASIVSGAIIILLIGDAPVVGEAGVFDIQMRMRFQDGQLTGQLPKFWGRSTKGNWNLG